MSHNLEARSKEERDNASGVAYKERMNMPVIPMKVEMQPPEEYRDYSTERLQHFRNAAVQFPRGADPFYFKEEK